MPIKRPRLKRRILQLLGEHPEATIPIIVERMRKVYPLQSDNELAEAIDEALLELEQEVLIEIAPGNKLALTSFGHEDAKRLRVAREAQDKEKKKKQAIDKKKRESKKVHEEIKLRVAELANLLGKLWVAEHKLAPPDSPVIVDVIWYTKPDYNNISHAFEVQHHGDTKNAIHNLEAVKRHHPDSKLFLVVEEQSDLKKIRKLLGPKHQTSIGVIEAQQLEDWLQLLRSPKISKVLMTVKDLGLL